MYCICIILLYTNSIQHTFICIHKEPSQRNPLIQVVCWNSPRFTGTVSQSFGQQCMICLGPICSRLAHGALGMICRSFVLVSERPRSLMFIPNIRATFSDEQQAHWLPRAEGWEIIGCYVWLSKRHKSFTFFRNSRFVGNIVQKRNV